MEPDNQQPAVPPMSEQEIAAMQQPLGGPMQVTLEEAHVEACRTIGEQLVTIRLLSQRVSILTQMLQQQQPPAASPPNRQQRRSTQRKGGANGKAAPPLAPVRG